MRYKRISFEDFFEVTRSADFYCLFASVLRGEPFPLMTLFFTSFLTSFYYFHKTIYIPKSF